MQNIRSSLGLLPTLSTTPTPDEFLNDSPIEDDLNYINIFSFLLNKLIA